MKKTYQIIILLAAIFLLPSCSGDDASPDLPSDFSAQLSFTLRVPRSGSGEALQPGEDNGTPGEAFIDLEGNRLRMFIFGGEADDAKTHLKYLTPLRLTHTDRSDHPEAGYTDYHIVGVAQGLKEGQTVKIMALANWPDFPVPTKGATTVDEICGNTGFIYTHEAVTGKPGTDFLMPFYGIEDVTMRFDKSGAYTGETIEISMLRALAKIEVSLQNRTQYDLESVSLVNWNNRAFCAPTGVYSGTDYAAGGINQVWETPLNVPGQDRQTAPLALNAEEDETPWDAAANPTHPATRTRFTVYVPEIANNASMADDDRPCLLLQFKDVKDKETSGYKVYFAGHSAQADAQPYDLLRNWWYRLEVSKSGKLDAAVTLAPYTGVNLKPVFGFEDLIKIEDHFTKWEDTYEEFPNTEKPEKPEDKDNENNEN